MYHVSTQGVDERMLNVQYYYILTAIEHPVAGFHDRGAGVLGDDQFQVGLGGNNLPGVALESTRAQAQVQDSQEGGVGCKALRTNSSHWFTTFSIQPLP